MSIARTGPGRSAPSCNPCDSGVTPVHTFAFKFILCTSSRRLKLCLQHKMSRLFGFLVEVSALSPSLPIAILPSSFSLLPLCLSPLISSVGLGAGCRPGCLPFVVVFESSVRFHLHVRRLVQWVTYCGLSNVFWLHAQYTARIVGPLSGLGCWVQKARAKALGFVVHLWGWRPQSVRNDSSSRWPRLPRIPGTCNGLVGYS